MRTRLLLILLLWTSALCAQDYAWPTNASQWITSTFGESRPRRFHAGFDVKTWNQVGYQAIAVRDGYIMRMRISPFGYGRALYVKLDTGEIAVYAHLLKFSDRLQTIAEAEQDRRGRYSIEKQFPPGALPVKKDEVIAYTGQSGIGVPHLHFELRNARNQPTNPLRMGFKLDDEMPPTIVALAVKPLESGSMVNGDFRPQILPPIFRGGRRQEIEQPIAIAGKVGMAISAYDGADGVNNRYSVYSLKLFVDNQLQFQAQYDELDYDLNRYVELDRDYALDRNGYGQFYKLYKEPANRLSFYSQLNLFGGALVCREDDDPITAVASTHGTSGDGGNRGADDENPATVLSWGMHSFRIEVADYFGNVSTLAGQLLAGPSFSIEPILLSADDEALVIKQITSPQSHEIRDVEVHVLQGWPAPLPLHSLNVLWMRGGKHWRKIPAELQTVFQPTALLPLAGFVVPQLTISTAGADLIRLVAIDADSLRSLPCFIPVSFYRGPVLPLRLQVRREFYPQYLRLEIEASQPLAAPPQLTLTSPGAGTGSAPVPAPLPKYLMDAERGRSARGIVRPERVLRPPLLPVEPNLYIAQVPLASLNGFITIQTSVEDLSGQRAEAVDSFAITPVPANGAGVLASADGNLEVNFWSGSLYGPLYGHTEVDTLAPPDPLRLSAVYRCSPKDVPLADGANVVFSFAAALSEPEQLGVYYREDNKWVFIDNRLDVAKRKVSARVFSLEDFAIYRDNQPPELSRFEPDNGATARGSRPTISVAVRDLMSGFASEESIVLLLDGRKVIAEYDPERDLVVYSPKQPLWPGRHEYAIRAVDRSGNLAEKVVSFMVP